MADSTQKLSAPYASFSSLIGFCNKLQETGIPGRIDASVFGNASGTLSYSIISALKSLKLIDENNIPSKTFSQLVNGDEQARKNILKEALRKGYPTLWDGSSIDLKTATAGQFDEYVRNEFSVKGSTVDKIAAFFIAAANFVEEPISAHLKARKSTAASTASKKNGKQKRKETTEETVDVLAPIIQKTDTSGKPLEYQLIDLMTEPDIEDEVKQSIWSLVQYLAKRKAKLEQKV